MISIIHLASPPNVSRSNAFCQSELVQRRSCIRSILYIKSEFHLWAYVKHHQQRFTSQVWYCPTG